MILNFQRAAMYRIVLRLLLRRTAANGEQSVKLKGKEYLLASGPLPTPAAPARLRGASCRGFKV